MSTAQVMLDTFQTASNGPALVTDFTYVAIYRRSLITVIFVLL